MVKQKRSKSDGKKSKRQKVRQSGKWVLGTEKKRYKKGIR